MSVKTFTSFGVQRSGTNFLTELITGNFKNIKDERYVWKHTPDTFQVIQEYEKIQKHDHLHLVISKNPYKWIESMKRNPVDIIVTIKGVKEIDSLFESEILNCNTDLQWNKNTPQRNKSWYVEKLSIPGLMYFYNTFYNNWLNMKNEIKYWGVVRYEALLNWDNTSMFLENMADTFSLQPKIQNNWTYPIQVHMSQSWHGISKPKKQDYLEQNKIKTLTNIEIETIYNNVDKELLKKLGYPTDKPISLIG